MNLSKATSSSASNHTITFIPPLTEPIQESGHRVWISIIAIALQTKKNR